LFPNGLEVERDIPTAIYWLNRAADSGKAEALAALDDLCREGRGCKRDYQEAHRLYLRVAEHRLYLRCTRWAITTTKGWGQA
jgi:TPR repeat protein